MSVYYKDKVTGELLERVTDWKITNDGVRTFVSAYFKTKSGATFSMDRNEVELSQ
ncbi:hypothetical protein [Paenibacillus cremeus]|uniref:hypothetical protein n=1 Tax=Paenibacillus cremeus TaxID=2163881 RepID=UPI0016477CE3|nr:hypothetical protein [Paenibacillus cremeus]